MTTATDCQLERITCTRCGGSGRHSSCQTMRGIHGCETCFKCLGRGQCFTKRAAIANQMLTDGLSVPAHTLRPGDMVRFSGLSGAQWVEVVEFRKASEERHDSCRLVDGRKVFHWTLECVSKKGERFAWGGILPTHKIRKAHSKTEKLAKLALAVAFQDCLTKAGKVRKDSVDKAAAIKAELNSNWTRHAPGH